MYTCMTSQNFYLQSFLLSANYACTCTDMSLKSSWGTTAMRFKWVSEIPSVPVTLLASGWTSLQADCLISLRASSNASASSLPMPTSMPTPLLRGILKWRQHSENPIFDQRKLRLLKFGRGKVGQNLISFADIIYGYSPLSLSLASSLQRSLIHRVFHRWGRRGGALSIPTMK